MPGVLVRVSCQCPASLSIWRVGVLGCILAVAGILSHTWPCLHRVHIWSHGPYSHGCLWSCHRPALTPGQLASPSPDFGGPLPERHGPESPATASVPQAVGRQGSKKAKSLPSPPGEGCPCGAVEDRSPSVPRHAEPRTIEATMSPAGWEALPALSPRR